MHEPARIGVLLSGRGSNFLALQAAIDRGEVPARIVLVASNLISTAIRLARSPPRWPPMPSATA